MKGLLGFRERCISFSEEYGFILVPICKFAVAFAAFRMINSALGYMAQMNNLFLVLLMSLISDISSTRNRLFICAIYPNAEFIIRNAANATANLQIGTSIKPYSSENDIHLSLKPNKPFIQYLFPDVPHLFP